MGIFLALIAGLFIPLTNLCIRKSMDIGGNAKAFFVFQMMVSALAALFLGPLQEGDFFIPLSPSLLGALGGILFSIMLFSLGRALEKGPPGFTFAILNSATVMPGLLMALAFGAAYGFLYNSWHAIGSALVLISLFWGAKGMQGIKEMKLWVCFAILMFCSNTLLLGLYQYRAMLIKLPSTAHFASEWFTLFMFFTCGCIQLLIYLRSESKLPQRGEIFFGLAGGITNFFCTFFLLWAAEKATPLENAMIFPIFSIVGIVLTNLWSQKLYSEQVNWKACQLSVFGLLIGTMDWEAVSTTISTILKH